MATSKKLNKRQIKLNLPSYLKKESKLKAIATLENQCREMRHFPVQVLREITKYLHDFNRTKLKSARQFELIEHCILFCVPLINSIFSRYHKNHPLPEDDEKRELVILSCNVCNEITNAYLRLFEHDMNLSILRYNRHRERISISGHRIMEFVYAEQRLRTLRYQDLGEDDWKNVNLVFKALYCFEDIQFQNPSLGILNLSVSTNRKKIAENANSRIVSLYISIQLNGCVDMFSLATQQSHIAANKVRQYVSQLTISENVDVPVSENHVITFASNSGAASFSSKDHDDMEFSIDVSQFRKNIKLEFDKVETLLTHSFISDVSAGSSEAPNPPLAIASQEDIELRISLAVVLDSLNLHERVEERIYIGHVDPLFIFNGYKICFKILLMMGQINSATESNLEREEIQDSDIRDMLSQRSATISDDETKNESSKWLISNSSEHGVLAETRETRFTHNMFVGQLVLYGIGDISSGEFTLAYVSRMHRDLGDKLQIAIVNLSKKAELVVVQSAQLKKSALGLPGILLTNFGEGIVLALHTSHRLQPDTDITLTRKKKSYDYCTGKILMIQREFTLYQLVAV